MKRATVTTNVRENGSLRIITHISEKTPVQQQFKDECDINRIMSSAAAGQPISHLARTAGSYGDFSHISDFQTALQAVKDAEQAFMQLPARTRARFLNDPHELIKFVQDPANQEEAIELGIVSRPSSPTNAIDELNDNANVQAAQPTTKAKPRPTKKAEVQTELQE